MFKLFGQSVTTMLWSRWSHQKTSFKWRSWDFTASKIS